MRSHNVTRTKNLEFKRGINSLLQANAFKVNGNRFEVTGLGDEASALTGTYDAAEYRSLANRTDVMVVCVSVRPKVA